MTKLDKTVFPLYNADSSAQHLVWKADSSKILCQTPIFDLESVHRKSTDGREGDFVRLTSPDWVNVIPLFKGDDRLDYFVMERQFRHGSDSVTLEFPGGIIEEGEEPVKAALRELEEETGVRARKITFLGEVNPNSAFLKNRGYFFLAEELEYTNTRHFDPNEQIETVCVSAKDFFSKMGTGEFDNAVMAVAGFFYLKERNKI